MRVPLSRRSFLGGGAGLMLGASADVVLGAGTAQASAPDGAGRPGGSQAGIAVACWGGAYAEALHALVDEPLAKEQGIAVRQVLSGEPERVTRLLAQEIHAAPGGPEGAGLLDVALLSDVDAYRLSLHQIFLPVTTDGVSALPSVLQGLRAPYGVPQGSTALCIVHKPAKRGTAPRGFTDLLEAARKGQAGFSSELAIHNLAAAAIGVRPWQASLEAAKPVFLALKKAGTLRIYPTNDALGKALVAGEVTMAPMWRARAHVWRQSGFDLLDTVPVEGAVPFTIMGTVPKGTRHAAPAKHYLDWLLRPEIQAPMAQRLGLLPTVRNVRIGEKLFAEIGFTPGQRARFRPLSMEAVAKNGVALRRFWDQELA